MHMQMQPLYLILKSKKGPFEQLDIESCNSQCIGSTIGMYMWDN